MHLDQSSDHRQVLYIVAENQLQKAVYMLQFSVTTMLLLPLRDGGVIVTFSGEQTLYGSYGGNEGTPVRPASALAFGFYVIECVNKAHCSSNSLHFMWDLLTVLSSSTQSSTIMFWVLEKPKVSPSLNQIHINPTNTVLVSEMSSHFQHSERHDSLSA